MDKETDQIQIRYRSDTDHLDQIQIRSRSRSDPYPDTNTDMYKETDIAKKGKQIQE